MAQFDISLVTGGTVVTITPTQVYVTGSTTISEEIYVTGTTVVSGETIITGATQTIQRVIITGETITSGVTTTAIFSGLTSSDGGLITSGILKFESRFLVGTTNVLIVPKLYRSRAIFEVGYKFIEILDYPREFYLNFTSEEFYLITPATLFAKVLEFMNNTLRTTAFEIIQY